MKRLCDEKTRIKFGIDPVGFSKLKMWAWPEYQIVDVSCESRHAHERCQQDQSRNGNLLRQWQDAAVTVNVTNEPCIVGSSVQNLSWL